MRRFRASGGLVVGSSMAGLLAYVVFAVTTRALGADDAAAVSVLWSFWAFAAAALTFPLQHWVTRSTVQRGPEAVRGVLLPLTLGVLVLGLLATVAAAAARQALFDRPDAAFPVMVGLLTAGSAALGVTRGVLAARSRFGALAGSLVAENAIRCLGVVTLAVAGVDDPVAYGLCLVAGYLVAVPRPSTVRSLRWGGTTGLLEPARFLFGAGLSQLVHQLLLTGGPVVLALSGGSAAEVTLLFVALALFRAPYMLALGLAGQLSAHVARLSARGDGPALRSLAGRFLAGGALVGLLGALGGAVVGPSLLRLVFGLEVTMAAGQAAVVAAGCSLALACLALTVMTIARGAAGRSAAAWLGATVAATVLFGLLVLATEVSPSDRVAWSFLVAEAVALAGLGVAAGLASRTRV